MGSPWRLTNACLSAFSGSRLNLFAGKPKNLTDGHLDSVTQASARFLCTFFVRVFRAPLHALFAESQNRRKCKHCQDISSRICLARMMRASKEAKFCWKSRSGLKRQTSLQTHMRKESIVTETLAQNQEFTVRCQQVLQVAKQLFQGRPDWVTFFREVLGVNGAARNVFPDQAEYVLFEQSPEFADIQTMVGSLRNKKASSGSKNEVTRVITVRLPESLHEALKAEAVDHKTSMNKLCISKLLQALIDEEENGRQPAASSAEVPARQSLGTNAQPPQQTTSTQQAPQSPQFRSTFPGQ